MLKKCCTNSTCDASNRNGRQSEKVFKSEGAKQRAVKEGFRSAASGGSCYSAKDERAACEYKRSSDCAK